MEIVKVLAIEPHGGTDLAEKDTQFLSAIVHLQVRHANGTLEEIPYGINPPTPAQKAAFLAKVNKAWDEYTVRFEAWEVDFAAGNATEAQKPVFKEPVDNSNENKVRIVAQQWLNTGGKISDWVPPEPAAELIKAEAARRILEVAPEWYQRNLTARAAELSLKGVDNWTAEEQAEVAEGQAIWDKIKGIRAASNALEAMDPRPFDFATNEAYWAA
ncbi:hypothetical protein ABLO27_17520 [Roseibium sp. SCPC15]|uniref:hypothetical protein n=1 Tax=Roseibium sp. SCP15 TaxID=3141376 RepID=UPI0033351E87